MAAIGLSRDEFLATYSLVIRDPTDAVLPVARPDDAGQRTRRLDAEPTAGSRPRVRRVAAAVNSPAGRDGVGRVRAPRV